MRRSGNRIVALLGLATALALPVPNGDARAGTDGDATAQLTAINATLDRLTRILEVVVERQRADLLLRRIELAERRVRPHLERLTDAERRAHGLAEEVDSLASLGESLEKALDAALQSGAEQNGHRNQLDLVTSRLELTRGKLEDAERRVLELEINLERRRENLDDLDVDLAALVERLERLDDRRTPSDRAKQP